MAGLVIAFKDYSPATGIFGSPWAGLKYFNQFFSSFQFATTMKNTLKISIYSILVGFPLPIVLAIICNQIRVGKFKKIFQVTTYLPHFISTMVMCGMIILFLSPSSGLLANVLKLVGLKMPASYLNQVALRVSMSGAMFGNISVGTAHLLSSVISHRSNILRSGYDGRSFSYAKDSQHRLTITFTYSNDSIDFKSR